MPRCCSRAVEKPKGIFFSGVNRVIDGGTAMLVSILRVLVRARVIVSLVFVGLLGLTYWVYNRVPTGFVPDEDQGYIFVLIQAPPGASLDYTRDIVKQVEDVMKPVPEMSRVFAAVGFSFAGAAPNQGIVFAQLKDFAERKGEAHSVAGGGRSVIRAVQPDHRRAGDSVPAAVD